jgi:hypothetical protein
LEINFFSLKERHRRDVHCLLVSTIMQKVKNLYIALIRRGSGQFLRPQKWGTGRRKKFGVRAEVTKPINPARIFASFCNFFSQREKVWLGVRKRGALSRKIICDTFRRREC